MMETVYYIHNFKGRNGGTLFRSAKLTSIGPICWKAILSTVLGDEKEFLSVARLGFSNCISAFHYEAYLFLFGCVYHLCVVCLLHFPQVLSRTLEGPQKSGD